MNDINRNQKHSLFTEWLHKARDDELTIGSLLKHRDAPPSGVCFFSQQMAEKYLKAYLVFHKRTFPKVHLLLRLLELCIEVDPSFQTLKEEAALLDVYYIPARYPSDYPEFSWQEAERAFEAAVKIKDFASNKIVA